MTEAGTEILDRLGRRADGQVGEMLDEIPVMDRKRLLSAMATIEQVLGGPPAAASCDLRSVAAGDIGWLIQRHGELYGQEYGFDEHFEALVARIASDYVRQHDSQRERLWIAELEGRRVGSVMIVAESESVARFRLFLVEPWARGRKVGTTLINETLRFSRAQGYEQIVLTTVRQLDAARHLYTRAGFRKMQSKIAKPWGQEVEEEEWLLELAGSPGDS